MIRTGASLLSRALGPIDEDAAADGQLLARFAADRDDAAFAALVRRHAMLVLGVCRRVLRNTADAEDAFQAAFIVLARRAGALTSRPSVAAWLHEVARRVALNARTAAAVRKAREHDAATPEVRPEKAVDDRLELLDEELARLPEKYRLPLVLCDIEGLTRHVAAERMGCPEGTVAGRLARARAMLAKRLLRRAAIPAGVLMGTLATPPAALVAATLDVVLNKTTQSGAVLLAEGVMRTMWLGKMQFALLMALLVGGAAVVGFAAVPGASREPAIATLSPINEPPPPPDGATMNPDPKVLEDLARRLRSKDFDERTAALEALAKLLPKKATDGADFAPVIEPLFENAGWGGIATRNGELAGALIARIGLPTRSVLRTKLESADAHDRRVAAELLVRVGPLDADLVRRLRPLLADPDNFVRKAVTEGLATTGALAKDAIGDIERLATDDPNPVRRVGARLALVKIAGASPERVQALAALLELTETQEGAASYAASALGGLGKDGLPAEPQLRAALEHEQAQVRVNAAAACGEIGADMPETVAALIRVLKADPEVQVRRSAAVSLGKIGPKAKSAIPELAKALASGEKQWWVAADALVGIGGADAVPTLTEALSARDDDLRRAAIQGLGKLGPTAAPAVAALEKLSKDDPVPQNRTAADKAIRAITGK